MLDDSKKTSSYIDFQIDETQNSGVLKISGTLTEKKADDVRKTLEESSGGIDFVKLNLEEVTEVDPSSIHLLYSTCQSLGESNKPMSLDGICPVVFTSAVEDLGFSYHQWLCFGR
jgi:anti-anti-sigma regulatory factor